jgi:hypothetical protein
MLIGIHEALLRFALRGRGTRVLHLEPVGRVAGTVGRILPLRDGAFEAGNFVQCSISVAFKKQLAEAHPQSPLSPAIFERRKGGDKWHSVILRAMFACKGAAASRSSRLSSTGERHEQTRKTGLRVVRFLVALAPSGDLLIYAKDLFAAASRAARPKK